MKKYLKNRTLIAAFVVLIGVSGAGIIIKNGTHSNISSSDTVKISQGTSPNLKFNASKSLLNLLASGPGAATSTSNNLTQNLAKLYVKEILKQNTELTLDANGQATLQVPSQDVFDSLLQENLKQELKFSEFAANEIKIIADNSVQKQLDYITSLQNLTEKNFGGANANIFSALDKFLNDQDSEPLQKQIAAVSSQIQGLLKIPVPSLWKIFHLQALNLWQKNLVIYQSFLVLDQDPLKTYLALKDFANIFQEFDNLTTILTNRYRELSLNK